MNESQKYTPVVENRRESWFDHQWRPAMGWMYFCICIFDFIAAPIFTFWFFKHDAGTYQQWKPITMSEGGLFHMAMGVILGITSWTRGNEKINRYNNNVTYNVGPNAGPKMSEKDEFDGIRRP